MNNSQQDIDRILAALRNTEPSPNLDHRIITAIEHRTHSQPLLVLAPRHPHHNSRHHLHLRP